MDHGDLPGAVRALERAVALKPGLAAAHMNQGLALARLGRGEEAMASYRRATAAKSDFAEAHMALAYELIARGMLEEGWREYEWRFDAPGNGTVLPAVPRWRGEPLEGRRVLICSEQGAGDVLWAMRFLPRLHERGLHLTLLCVGVLRRLAQSSFPWLATVTPEEFGPADYDVLVPVMSLPVLAGMAGPEASASAYLDVDAALAEKWGARVTGHPGLRIGLAWAGNPDQGADAERSVPPAQLAELRTGAHDASWFSLQAWRDGRPLEMPFPMIDLMGEVSDFADTAAIVKALDLVIAVDTSIAHLAPAMGTRTFLLSRFQPGWRWLIAGRESPWYANVRMFRPPARRDWRPVVPDVVRAIGRLVDGSTG
jgi:hypothetical protein